MKRFKPSPELTKGLKTEERFIALVRSLQSELSFIQGVRKTGYQDDNRGVDVIVYTERPFGRGVQKIPFQVKSSAGGAFHFGLKRPEAVAAGLPVFVLHPKLRDAVAKRRIRKVIRKQRRLGVDFSHLYTKEQPKPQPKNEYLKPGESAKKKKLRLAEALQSEQREELRLAKRLLGTFPTL